VSTFRYLEHDADLGFEVEAASWTGVWDASARALCTVMTDLERIELRTVVNLRAEGIDLTAAWVESLSELLASFEIDGLLLREVRSLTVQAKEGHVVVEFTAAGERMNPLRHPSDASIKAVTHHDAQLERDADGRWRGRVLLDL
jgi:SHS2 domain-containing protein